MGRIRRIALIVALVTVPLALAGCVQGAPTAHPTKTHHSRSPGHATTAPTPVTSPSVVPTPTASPGKVSMSCDLVFTAQQAYSYNPNVVAYSAYSPAKGSLAESMAANSGLACGWINETSSVMLGIALELPPASGLAAAKASAARGTPTSGSGADAAYFAEVGSAGTLQLFLGRYWVDISSADFITGSDVQSVASAVVQNLRAAGG